MCEQASHEGTEARAEVTPSGTESRVWGSATSRRAGQPYATTSDASGDGLTKRWYEIRQLSIALSTIDAPLG